MPKPWRAPALPGVNAPVPPGAKGLPRSKGTQKLAKKLRTFDNTKTVEAMVPYAQAAETWLDAVTAQLANAHGDLGPAEMAILSSSALQMLWSRFLFDTAAKQMDPELAVAASKIADASSKNIIAANELRTKLREQQPDARRDPLAAFIEDDAA